FRENRQTLVYSSRMSLFSFLVLFRYRSRIAVRYCRLASWVMAQAPSKWLTPLAQRDVLFGYLSMTQRGLPSELSTPISVSSNSKQRGFLSISAVNKAGAR